MNILILGATGFIGEAIFHSLVSDYRVSIASRRPIEGFERWKKIDFFQKNDWNDLLRGIDLVINAIGIIEGDFDRVQTKSPMELYQVCYEKNIKIVHISALGAEKKNPSTTFLRTKKITDDYLIKRGNSKVIYPAMVLGRGGRSTQFFVEMARLPIIPVLNSQPMPFIHIRQLTKLIQQVILDFDAYPAQIFALAEPEPIQSVLHAIRGKKGRFITVPQFFFQAIFTCFPKASLGIFNRDTYKLYNESTVDEYPILFPKASQLIESKNCISSDEFPQFFALMAVSFIWIWSGISSLISWDESLEIMNEIGANNQFAILFIWLGSLVDIVLGIAVFAKKYRKKIILIQLLVMGIYMLILTVFAPHYWLHPFGVLSKNIPLIALSYYLLKK